jgi:hypothetical protein
MIQETFKHNGTEWSYQCFVIKNEVIKKIYQINLLPSYSATPFTSFQFTATKPLERVDILKQIQKHFNSFLMEWSNID